ncbi:MAG: hypothetical protein AB1349_05030 [Elusimicrobiota bacterium]
MNIEQVLYIPTTKHIEQMLYNLSAAIRVHLRLLFIISCAVKK